jgi:hypothetical protein
MKRKYVTSNTNSMTGMNDIGIKKSDVGAQLNRYISNLFTTPLEGYMSAYGRASIVKPLKIAFR